MASLHTAFISRFLPLLIHEACKRNCVEFITGHERTIFFCIFLSRKEKKSFLSLWRFLCRHCSSYAFNSLWDRWGHVKLGSQLDWYEIVVLFLSHSLVYSLGMKLFISSFSAQNMNIISIYMYTLPVLEDSLYHNSIHYKLKYTYIQANKGRSDKNSNELTCIIIWR